MPVLATATPSVASTANPDLALAIMDSAEEWAAFLNSSQADLLATQLPSEKLSRQFAADRHVQQLENFILEVALGREAMNKQRATPSTPYA